jgi:hypothetical protein
MIWRNRFPRIPSRSPQILGNRGETQRRRRRRTKKLRGHLGLRQLFAQQTLVGFLPNHHYICSLRHRNRQVCLDLRLGTRISKHTLHPCTEHRISLLGTWRRIRHRCNWWRSRRFRNTLQMQRCACVLLDW